MGPKRHLLRPNQDHLRQNQHPVRLRNLQGHCHLPHAPWVSLPVVRNQPCPGGLRIALSAQRHSSLGRQFMAPLIMRAPTCVRSAVRQSLPSSPRISACAKNLSCLDRPSSSPPRTTKCFFAKVACIRCPHPSETAQ